MFRGRYPATAPYAIINIVPYTLNLVVLDSRQEKHTPVHLQFLSVTRNFSFLFCHRVFKTSLDRVHTSTLSLYTQPGSRDSSVGIATGYGLDGQEVGVRNPTSLLSTS
jgi:hypothetical protein